MTFKIYTLGCKVNSYESQALRERLIKQGLVESKTKEADIYFVNTCAVTNEAERKDLQKVRSISKAFPSHPIAVMGCSSQIHKEKFLAIPGVKAIIGNSSKGNIECLLNEENIDYVNLDSRHFVYEETPTSQGEGSIRAYLKLQDGCDNFCTYCVVPFTRGNSRSRNHIDAINEAKEFIKNGYKEIVLSGIDIGSYRDPLDKDYDLSSLIKDLLKIDGDYRIRVSSIECSQITDEYIKLFKDNTDKLCPHFHMPLQSGSERILKMMNRKYTMEYFESTLNKIRQAIPTIALSCDVITGFPSETEEDFMMTYDFIKRNKFMRIHSFPYSERPFTMASKLKDSIPVNIREERTRRLIELSKENEEEYRSLLKGKEVTVLIEQKNKDNKYEGYSENYLRFELDSKEDITDKFIKVII